MRKLIIILLICCFSGSLAAQESRMEWWREARFGMFIHWGLYSVPAGEWQGITHYGEWIRHSAKIPLKTYDQFVQKFNPVKFDATAWVKMAKNAGMKYIVVTSKHHDGFCLFDSKQTDFDIMATPFKQDIMKELANACRAEGIRICWYHSIMDWHHPDYLPRRDWEKDRTTEGADFERYITYLKAELKELLTNYGDISVLWFDGEWEPTWNSQRGRDLLEYVRSLQPDIIVNNRVGAGRQGMGGFTKEGELAADFSTPEQEIPATGVPGLDWETCMTMNEHWGYSKDDKNWKSTKTLLQMLADIASKGGNYLLNVGPTSEGLFPQESIERLNEIGNWMKTNGEAIYGTQASLFSKLSWGRSTWKKTSNGYRIYLHVFERPVDGRLIVPGLLNTPESVHFLSGNPGEMLKYTRKDSDLIINLPENMPDAINSVIAIDLDETPDIFDEPLITAIHPVFINDLEVKIHTSRKDAEIRYTLDGTEPNIKSILFNDKIILDKTSIVKARIFRKGKAVSGVASETFSRVTPRNAEMLDKILPGLNYLYYEGSWDSLPDFDKLSHVKTGNIENFIFSPRKEEEHFGFVYNGYVKVPETGIYTFIISSDDGSSLRIGNELFVNNDGLHSIQEKSGVIALKAGLHPIHVEYFEATGGNELEVFIEGPGLKRTKINSTMLYR